MRFFPVVASIYLLLGPACFTGNPTDAVQGGQGTSCANCKHGTGGSSASVSCGGSSISASTGASGNTKSSVSGSLAGSSATSASAANSTSGNSSSSAGTLDAGCQGSQASDAGSTQPFACPLVPIPPYDGGCPSGEAVRSYLVDIATCEGVSATISAIDSNGVPVAGDSTLSDPCNGDFSLCTPQGGAFTLQIQAVAYPTTYTAEMTSRASGSFAQFVMLTSDQLAALDSFVPVTVDSNKDTIIVGLPSDSGQCEGPPKVGWTYALTLPDGGAFPDGGYFLSYQDTNFLPDPTLTATTQLGTAIFFNVDPTVSDYVLITAANPTPGTCDPRNASLGFTGRVLVTASALSYDAFLLP